MTVNEYALCMELVDRERASYSPALLLPPPEYQTTFLSLSAITHSYRSLLNLGTSHQPSILPDR